MKKLGKLEINSEKFLKEEDLKKLRGGWSGDCFIYLDGTPQTGGKYQGAYPWTCDDNYGTWYCDQTCAQHYHETMWPNRYVWCFCNFNY